MTFSCETGTSTLATRPSTKIWTLLQVSVHGKRAVTHVNGLESAKTDALTRIRPGHIVIQMHRDDSTIEFRDLVLVSAD